MEGKRILRRGLLGTASMFVFLFAMGWSAQAATFTVSSLNDDGNAGSLRKAIDDANIAPGEDQIVFASGLSGTINLTSDLPQITSPMTITGPGMDVIQVDGGDQFRPVTSFQPLKISGLGFLNGSVPDWSAFTVSAELELDGVRISGSTTDDYGGAILALDSGSLVLKNSVITGNEAYGGGGVYATGTDLTITDTRFSGNKATSVNSGGGGLLMFGSNLTVTGSEFTSNSTRDQGGGGILARGASNVNITDSTFTGNTVDSEASLFRAGGGAVSISGVNTTITGSEFTGNSSNSKIGGLLINGNSSISGSLIAGNEAEGIAGILLGDTFPAPAPDCSIEDSTIAGNTAQYTFGGIVSDCAKLEIESTTISGNEVTTPVGNSDGTGGLYQVNGTAELENTILSGNLPNDYAVDEDPLSVDPIVPGAMTASFSLIGDSAEGMFTDAVPSSNIATTNPMLGPLAENGGDLRTMLPAIDSPVVDQGLSAQTSDQRGEARTVDVADRANAAGGNGTDIGAVELQPDELSPPEPPAPSNRFSFGSTKVNRKTGVASLRVKVPGRGKLLVMGSKTVARYATTAKGKSTVAVKVKAKGRALKSLKKKGKVKVRVTVRFTPTGGTSRNASKNVKLIKTKKKRR